MSHKHAHLIHSLFQDPPSGNLHWREVESLLNHLADSVEQLSGSRIRVVINKHEGILHRPHHSSVCSRQEIKHIREYLASSGVTPSLYEAATQAKAN